MQVRMLNNEDARTVERFLSRHAETSMFLRSNMARAGLDYEDRDFAGQYWGAFQAGGLCGVLAHYWNGNIMMQAPDRDSLAALVKMFAQDKSRAIKGVIGAGDQAGAVIEYLGFKSADFAMNSAEGLYALDLEALRMPEYDSVSCELVKLTDMERATLFRWLKDYNIEALGAEDDEALHTRLEQEILGAWQVDNRRVLLKEGAPVSLAGFNAKVADMNQIGPVWIPPEHRGNGYARLAVALLLSEAKEMGYTRSILFTDNPAAIKAYQAIGYHRIGHFRLALLKA